MSDCEFESHQNCSENFINLLDTRLWVQIPPELQWKLIMDLLARWAIVSSNPTRTAVKTLY